MLYCTSHVQGRDYKGGREQRRPCTKHIQYGDSLHGPAELAGIRPRRGRWVGVLIARADQARWHPSPPWSLGRRTHCTGPPGSLASVPGVVAGSATVGDDVTKAPSA